jgi:hypothetical protein
MLEIKLTREFRISLMPVAPQKPIEHDYVVVTTIQTFRHRYVIPKSRLQELNAEAVADVTWATDSVVCENVKEFSQMHLGETILDVSDVTTEEALQLFDIDNEYLSGWTREKKLEWMDNCWENRE